MITLMEHQEEAKAFFLDNPNAILGDGMGLGKSYPTIEAGLQINGPKLIVCPAYLIPNWLNYLSEYNVQEDEVDVLIGSVAQKQVILAKRIDQRPEWTITSYDILARTDPKRKGQAYPELLQIPWKRIIYDEAHRLRGRNSLSTKAAFKMKTAGNWMLTGSPIYRDAGDVWPLLVLCDKSRFTSYWKFVEYYCHIEKHPWTKIEFVKKPQAFRRLLNNYMLRRLHEDVNLNIPAMLRPIVIPTDLSPAYRRSYEQARKDFILTWPQEEGEERQYNSASEYLMSGGALITKLRQLTGTDKNKLTALTNLVEDMGDERVVVFCWFRNSAQKVADNLKTKLHVSGALDVTQRQSVIDQFERQEASRLVATISSIKEGVNLQAASKVIFYEEDWLSKTNEQATARLHRIGQTEHVQSYYIHARRTVDESVHRIAQRREENIMRALLEDVLGQGVV